MTRRRIGPVALLVQMFLSGPAPGQYHANLGDGHRHLYYEYGSWAAANEYLHGYTVGLYGHGYFGPRHVCRVQYPQAYNDGYRKGAGEKAGRDAAEAKRARTMTPAQRAIAGMMMGKGNPYEADAIAWRESARGKGGAGGALIIPKDDDFIDSPEVLTHWEKGELLGKEFAKHLKTMIESALTLDALLKTDGTFPAFTGTAEQKLAQSIEYTAWNLERARLKLKSHRVIHESAYEAARLHPRLIAAIRGLADHFAQVAAKAEFPDQRQLYEGWAREYRRLAAAHEASPVLLPSGFDQTGRYLADSVRLLEEVLRAQKLIQTVPVPTFAPEAYNQSFDKFYAYFADWRDKQFASWRDGQRTRYAFLGIEIPKQPAGEDLERLTVFRPGVVPGSESAPAPSSVAAPEPTPAPVVAPSNSPSTSEDQGRGLLPFVWKVLKWIGIALLILIVLAIIAAALGS